VPQRRGKDFLGVLPRGFGRGLIDGTVPVVSGVFRHDRRILCALEQIRERASMFDA